MVLLGAANQSLPGDLSLLPEGVVLPSEGQALVHDWPRDGHLTMASQSEPAWGFSTGSQRSHTFLLSSKGLFQGYMVSWSLPSLVSSVACGATITDTPRSPISGSLPTVS